MHRPQTRWAAAGIHLGLSVVIFAVIMIFMWFYWYPGALFESAGGWQGVKIIAAIDVVLGPLLTLIIYNAGKKARDLTVDLGAIALIQFACLGAGLYVVINERPVAIVLVHDTFYTLKQNDLDINEIPPSAWQGASANGLELVYVEMPDDPAERQAMLAVNEVMGGSLSTRFDLYQPIPRHVDTVKKHLAEVSLSGTNTSCYTVNLISSYHSGTVCYNPDKHTFTRFKSAQ